MRPYLIEWDDAPEPGVRVPNTRTWVDLDQIQALRHWPDVRYVEELTTPSVVMSTIAMVLQFRNDPLIAHLWPRWPTRAERNGWDRATWEDYALERTRPVFDKLLLAWKGGR